MAESGRLRLDDVRAAYRLLGECRELGRDPRAWRLHMLEGLRRLAGAQVALYLQLRDVGTAAEQVVEPLDSGFLAASQRALWDRYRRERAQRDDPFHRRYYSQFSGAPRTRRLAAVVDLREWHRSRHYGEYVHACGLEDRITSSILLPGAPAAVQTLVLHRSAADGPYPQRAVRLVHFFHQELMALAGRPLRLPGTDAWPPLPLQLRHVLACLLEGDGEKQIAWRLGISRHTVNRHVQRLYRRFGVHGRGELTFLCRDLLPLIAAGRDAPDAGAEPSHPVR